MSNVDMENTYIPSKLLATAPAADAAGLVCGSQYHGREFLGIPHPVRGAGARTGDGLEAAQGESERKAKGPGVLPSLRDDDGRGLRAPGPGLDRSTPDLLSQSEQSQKSPPPSRITTTLRRTYHNTDTTGQACHIDTGHVPLQDSWTGHRPAKCFPPKPETPYNLIQHPESLKQKPRRPTDFWTPADKAEFAATRARMLEGSMGHQPKGCSLVSQQ
eukprot:jgi/Ulvmu1/6459/UM003_0090.1